MTKFSVGPAKCLAGLEAYIFEVSDKLYGKVLDGTWIACSWELDGKYGHWTDIEGYYDLDHGDREPYKAELVVDGITNSGRVVTLSDDRHITVSIRRFGKYKVTIEEILI